MDQFIAESGTTTSPLLSCRGVVKLYGAMAAVNNVNFEVRQGEVLGIGGPNGAGKTTLFDMISGLTPCDAGEIDFDNVAIRDRSPWEICHLGMARTFQLNAGFDTLTVRENVEVAAYFGRRNRAVPGLRVDRATRARVDDALALVGMETQADIVVKNLPVLGRKLLMLAGAVATEPKLVLMDEPVGGLNPSEIDQVMAIVERLRSTGITLIVIEHVMRFLVQLATRVLILHHGEKIYEGSAEGLIRDRTVVDVYLGEGASTRLAHVIQERASRAS